MKTKRGFVYHLCVVGLILSLLVGGSVIASAQVVTLRMWTNHGGEDAPLFETVARKFEELNPHIRIEVQNIPAGPNTAYYDRLTIAASSGTLPDLFYIRGGSGDMRFHALNVTLDLTPYIERDADEIDLADFHEAQIAELTYKGEWRALPYDYSVMGLYYNKELFDQAGVPYPSEEWTWEDFEEAAVALTQRNPAGRTLQWGAANFGFGQFLEGYLMSWGGRLFNDDYTRAIVAEDEKSLEALQFGRRLVQELTVVPRPGTSDVNPFQTGRAGMTIDGSWATMQHRRLNRFDWDVEMLPAGPAGRVISATGGGWAIAANTQHPDEAWEFLKYLTGPEATKLLIVDPVRSLPNRKSLLEPWAEQVQTGGDSPRNAIAFARALEYSRNTPTIAEDYSYHIEQMWPLILSDSRSVPELAQILQERINADLE